MKYPTITCASLVLIAALFSFNAGAGPQEEGEGKPKLTGEVLAALVNNYYWRGAYLYPENVPAFQPEATLGYWIFNLNVWNSTPLRLRDDLKDVRDEVDLTLSATFEADSLSLEVGFIEYLMTASDPLWHTEELAVIPTYQITDEFSLSLSIYGDVSEMKGVFMSLSPTYERQLHERVTVSASLLLSCQTYRGAPLAFVELGVTGELDVTIVEGFYFAFGMLFNYNVDRNQFLYFFRPALAYAW